MSGSSGMHGGGSSAGSGGLNGVKLEGPGYYCNSYTPPAPVDHGLLSTTYSKCFITFQNVVFGRKCRPCFQSYLKPVYFFFYLLLLIFVFYFVHIFIFIYLVFGYMMMAWHEKFCQNFYFFKTWKTLKGIHETYIFQEYFWIWCTIIRS